MSDDRSTEQAAADQAVADIAMHKASAKASAARDAEDRKRNLEVMKLQKKERS